MDAFPLEVGSHGVRVGVLRVGGCICRGGVVGWKALISPIPGLYDSQAIDQSSCGGLFIAGARFSNYVAWLDRPAVYRPGAQPVPRTVPGFPSIVQDVCLQFRWSSPSSGRCYWHTCSLHSLRSRFHVPRCLCRLGGRLADELVPNLGVSGT